jgi:L-amino acid N-acyltransferase YncA
MEIRPATAADLVRMLAIYNDVLATATAIDRDDPMIIDEYRGWWHARTAQEYPVLVAADGQAIAGYASFGDFRAWPGYRFTVEHTVHVRDDCRGRGVGTALVGALIDRAQLLRKHVMIAGVDADNAASLRFHQRLSFEQVAHFREVGFKFGRWLDLVFLQRMLDRPGPDRPSIRFMSR